MYYYLSKFLLLNRVIFSSLARMLVDGGRSSVPQRRHKMSVTSGDRVRQLSYQQEVVTAYRTQILDPTSEGIDITMMKKEFMTYPGFNFGGNRRLGRGRKQETGTDLVVLGRLALRPCGPSRSARPAARFDRAKDHLCVIIARE